MKYLQLQGFSRKFFKIYEIYCFFSRWKMSIIFTFTKQASKLFMGNTILWCRFFGLLEVYWEGCQLKINTINEFYAVCGLNNDAIFFYYRI